MLFLSTHVNFHFIFQDEEDEDDSDDEDETAELLAELEKIKKEREREQANKVCELFWHLSHDIYVILESDQLNPCYRLLI